MAMIITTINQFIEAVPTVNSEIDFADLRTYIKSGELWLKNNVLGATLFARVEAFQEPQEPDATLQELCINVIANHAYWDAIPFLDLVHTPSGFGVINNNQKAPASKERVERLRLQCLTRRDNEVENLIRFLEENAVYHDDWEGSPVYSLITDCLIRSASELRNFASWEGERNAFLLLKPKLVHFTMNVLNPVFSRDLIEMLIEKQRDNDLSADELQVVTLLKHALGCLIDENKNIAGQIATDALRFIDENIASFTTYTSSKEYAARQTAGYENELESTIFSSLM